MHRFLRRTALAVVCALSLACQSYNFNPVSQCLIQPGIEQVTLSNVSTADVLFVVDDSGSMASEQTRLATAFDDFIDAMDAYNLRRVENFMKPFDFHIAVTTTSVFQSRDSGAVCASSCGGTGNVCCIDGTDPLRVPKTCPAGTGCTGTFGCRKTCLGHAGEDVCCDASGASIETTMVACDSPGEPCGTIQNRYAFQRRPHLCTNSTQCTAAPYTKCAQPATGELGCGGYSGDLKMCCATTTCSTNADCPSGFICPPGGCNGLSGVCCSATSPTYAQGEPEFTLACVPGIATEGELYPRGGFVGLGTNPRVLHYDKRLYGVDSNGDGFWEPVPPTTATNNQGFTRADLRAFFAANVVVGTCGSGQEQGLQAARLAIAKALSGKQRDTRSSTGAIVPAPGVTADWPHAGAKLVVVYVGDEDDCSSPEDPFKGVVLSGPAGNDTCVNDALERERPVADFVNDLEALDRPLGAAFVVSAAQTTCVDEGCTPGICADASCGGHSATCGGQAAGARFLQAAAALRTAGSDVVSASICDSGFGTILGRIAEIVKPPSALELPTRPADAQMTVLRIATADGTTRKFCVGPALPPADPPLVGYLTDPSAATSRALAFQAAVASGQDWWFTEDRDQIDDADKAPWSPTRFVYINHLTNNCEPNPGEVYSAEYLGMLPPGTGCQTEVDCTAALGTETEWTCFAGLETSGLCRAPTLAAAGTCVCGKRADVCPLGPP